MSSEVVDFQARSMEGRGLSMKAQERWVDIQKHTFLNWVNLQLQGSGLIVTDPEADFDDGVRLCALVEALQNRKIGRVIKKPMNHHQNLENVTLALNAIAEDNVRLVNIGSEDIVNGSTKLILGLVWTLILRYQIGKTKIPPKKLMLAWLKAVIPECAISNFTSDWNDGVALHALVEYCQPGLCPNWRQLSRHSRLENCTEAMEMAKEKLNIPIVVRPEDFSSSHLDDLSGMTYLSYYMMVDAPGYLATRREIRALLQEGSIDNFTTDWNDGRLLANLVTSVGGTAPEVTSDSVQTLQNGIDSARRLGIEPIFQAKEIADPEVEHLGVMAYAAYFRKFQPVKRRINSARMRGEFDDVMVRQEKHFTVTAQDDTDHSVIRVEVTGPDASVPVRVDWDGDQADCSFTPTETGHHKLNVTCEEKPVPGCPVSFKVLSDRSKVYFDPLDKAVVGYNSELIVNTTEAGEGEVRIEAESPSGKVVNMPVMYKNGIHMANFTPSEIGDWQMSMIYEGEHVTGSPYTLPVIDPSLVQISNLEDGKVGQENSFDVDASMAGNGELRTEVFHDGWTVPCPLEAQEEAGKYRGSFVPQSTGSYNVRVFFSDIEVKGSPQEVEVVDTTRVSVTGEGLSLVPVNTPAIFTIHTQGAGGGKVDVDITAPSGYKVPWNITRLNKDTYRVEYRVTQPGKRTLLWLDIDIATMKPSVMETSYMQEEKHYSSHAVTQNGETISKAFSGGNKIAFHGGGGGGGGGGGVGGGGPNFPAISGGGTTMMDDDDDGDEGGTFQFGFPGQGSAGTAHPVPITTFPSDTSSHYGAMSTASSSRKGGGKRSSSNNNNNTTRSYEIIKDFNDGATNNSDETFSTLSGGGGGGGSRAMKKKGGKVFSSEKRSSTMENYEVISSSSSSRGKQHHSSSSGLNYNHITPLEIHKDEGFSPLQSSTLVNSSKHGVSKALAKSSNNNSSGSAAGGRGDQIFYETIPVVHSGSGGGSVAWQGHNQHASAFQTFSSSNKEQHQHQHHHHHRQQQQQQHSDNKHVSSFSVKTNKSSSIRPERSQRIHEIVQQQQQRPEVRSGKKGEYTINVQFGGQEVTKTPFVTKAYDSKRLLVSNMPVVASRDKPVQFNIDASQAGSGNIEIRVNEGRVPCSVENKGNHRFVASFTPENSRPHAVEMSFNDMAVEGSPWSVDIVDKNNINVSGDEWVQIHRSASASIATNGQKVTRSDLQVSITGPEGETVPFNLANEADGNCSVEYIPTAVGNYDINVKYGGLEVAGSPFVAKAYNTGAILVTPLKDGFVNQPMFFTIDVGDAGEGQLQIMVNNGNIRNEVEPQDPGTYRIKFVPVDVGRQEVVIKFNDHNVPNSPLTCMALDLSANVVGLNPLIPVMTETSFSIQSQSPVADVNTDVSITGPSGQKVPVRMKHTGDRKVLDMEYMPREVGAHQVNIAFNGHHIKGSPFQVKTFDPDQVKVTKVKQGIVGVPCKFKVDASNAGDGTLEIAVTNNGLIVPNSAQPLGNNCYEISFLGEREGPHKVSVTYNGMHAQGSPYSVPMLDVGDMKIDGDAWNLIRCHQPGQFNIQYGQGNISDLHVKITGPNGTNVPCRLSDRGNGTARLDWTPNQIGTHKVHVDYGGIPIKGSPFSIRVFDPSMVSVSKIGSGLVNKPVNFTLDASEAGDGNLEILVMCDNEVVPNYVTQEGQTKFRVNFTPKRAGLHVIHMQFNGESLRDSPHNCQVFDPDSVYVSGDGVNMAPANQQTSFMVNMKNAGDAKLNVKVVAPRGDEIPVHFSGNPKTGIKIDYTPYEVGVYKVYVDCGGVPVHGSPFSCNVFDQSLIRINAPGRAYLGKPIRFHVDASAAGEGNLNFQVKCHGSEVPVRIQETARDRYDVTFTPQRSMTHHVLVFYNNIQVPGTPFDVPVIDGNSVTLSGDGPRRAKIYKEARLNLEHQGLDEKDLDVHVVGPSGSQIPARISRHGKLFGIEFTPMEVGVHRVTVNVGDSPVKGSPFKCNVYDPSAVRIIEIDKTPNKEREIGFTIDSGSAGAGDLEVTVSHKGQPVPAKCRQIGEGRYTYSFKPMNVGRYEVRATFNGEAIPGSPLIIDVEEDHPTFIRINMSSSEPINTQGKNYFLLHMNGRNVERDMLNIIVLAPNGEKIAARLIQQPDGDYKVEWTPNNPGRHSVDVLYGGQQIHGSPFYIDVFDIHKIRVNNFYCGNVGEKAGFRIDCTQAGQGDQEIRVQSPTGRIVPHQLEETAHLDYNVSYTPVEVGTHQVFISYSGMELNGSPFHQEIFEGALPSASGDGLHRGEEDKPASFIIDARRMNGEPTVQVDGPQSIAKCNMDHLPDGQYKVTYIPVEVGIFTAQVKWNGKDIPGSPFHPKIVNALKVRVIGGWQHYMDSQERVHLVVGEEKQIPFDTSEAGSGHLRAEVKSPSAFIPVTVDEEHKGKSVVKFVPQEEGNHYIHLYWCDHPLVNSPYLGYATSGVADPSKVILSGRGVKEGVVREEAEFIIDGSQAGPGEPDVQLIGVRAEIQVFTTPLGGGKYRCTYIPVVPGAYLLHISWNGRQLRGSPYKVNVIGASYPNRVVVNGEGLKGGLLGQNLDFRIDTRKAGPGELTAYCMGPTKVAYCELSDHHDGTYRLAVRAQEVGRHVLQIKYGGEHVQGSPFAFKVSAQPDASKVRVSGPGVEHGLLANFQSNFIVETKGAGAGQLTVRIRGPKGAFQVEMYRESHKDRTILCRYYPTVTGLYIINVRWSGVDVPGSPFHVNILDTHQELEHVLRDQGYTPNGHQHNSFSSSNGGGMINNHHNNNSNNNSRLAYSHHQQQQQQQQQQMIHQHHSSQNHAHNTSRSSGYYAWRGDD